MAIVTNLPAEYKKHTLYGAATVSLKTLVEQIGNRWQEIGGLRPLNFNVINPGGPSQVQAQVCTMPFSPGSVVVCMTQSSFIYAAPFIPRLCSVIVLDSPLELSALPYITPTDYNPENPWQLVRPPEPFNWTEMLYDLAYRVTESDNYEKYFFHVKNIREQVGLSQAVDLTGLESGSLLSALADLTTINSLALRTLVRRSLAQYLMNEISLDALRTKLEDASSRPSVMTVSGVKDSGLPISTQEELSQPAIRHLLQSLTKRGTAYRAAVQERRHKKTTKAPKGFSEFEISFLCRLVTEESLQHSKGLRT